MEIKCFLGVLLLAAFARLASCNANPKCKVLDDINGCSVPLPTFPFMDTFEPACVFHDVCYRCGYKYGFPQVDCDKSFRTNMQIICKNQDKSTRSRQRRGIIDTMKRLGVIFDSLKNGWKKATENVTSADEAKRLWNGALEVFSLVKNFLLNKHVDYLSECLQAANVYSRAVEVFGVYRYRLKNPDYCTETCAKSLADPVRRIPQM